jgi:hypothetical protein
MSNMVIMQLANGNYAVLVNEPKGYSISSEGWSPDFPGLHVLQPNEFPVTIQVTGDSTHTRLGLDEETGQVRMLRVLNLVDDA